MLPGPPRRSRCRSRPTSRGEGTSSETELTAGGATGHFVLFRQCGQAGILQGENVDPPLWSRNADPIATAMPIDDGNNPRAALRNA